MQTRPATGEARVTASICSRVAGEQTKMAMRGPLRVGNGSGGRLDAEDRAHVWGEHGGTGEGPVVDLGEGELAMEIGWTS